MSQIQEAIANFGTMMHKSARDQERIRIINILADKICPECEHATCWELTKAIREINRGKGK